DVRRTARLLALDRGWPVFPVDALGVGDVVAHAVRLDERPHRPHERRAVARALRIRVPTEEAPSPLLEPQASAQISECTRELAPAHPAREGRSGELAASVP